MPVPDHQPQPGGGHRPEPLGDAFRIRKTLTPAEAALLELIDNLSKKWGVCKAGVWFLAQELRCSERYVQLMLGRLHEKGCLAITYRRGKSSVLKVLRRTPEDTPLQVRDSDGVNDCAPHPRTTVHPRGRTAVHPTKGNTLTSKAGGDAGPLYAAGGPGWFNAWEACQPGKGELPAEAVVRVFRQGNGTMFCAYTGNKPDWLEYRREHLILEAQAGQFVLFLKLADESTGRARQVRVNGGALASWRFR